ncbi:uncharacterized protein fs(1)N [Euwallacea fornicatus]|uniref:uncharacterized protein fs(1)N n=1 Tax=Euwallacea fornicatus TaxID=995702 RepID=UPI00338DBEF1
MSATKNVLSVLICWRLFLIINSSEDEWNFYESKFVNYNREEIFISNVTTSSVLPSNLTVKEWKTLNTGYTSYTGGILNGTRLAVLFSTIKPRSDQISHELRFFDLNETIRSIEFFHEYDNNQVWVIALAQNRGLVWYSLSENSLDKGWVWPFEHTITHFHTFKMKQDQFLLANLQKNQTYSAVIYGFEIASREQWLYQSLYLPQPSCSSCFSTAGSDFFLSFVHSPSNILEIYKLTNNHFVQFTTLKSPQIDQVICFEDVLKSFVAVSGLGAGIFEFTEDGLVKREIVDSNLESLQMWLPMSVSTYRDETVLMFQRKLDHDSHKSNDVEIVTYNGKKFEEHMDISCQFFGEMHSSLECFTEFNPTIGILGSSYIAIKDQIALVVPNHQTGSVIFNMKVGFRKVEHPVKKNLDFYMDLKQALQTMIDQQNRQLAELKNPKEYGSNESPSLKHANLLSSPEMRTMSDTTHDKLQEIESEVARLNAKYKELKAAIAGDSINTIIFNGPTEVLGSALADEVHSEDEELNSIINDIVRKDNLNKSISGRKVFEDLTVRQLFFQEVNGVAKEDLVFIDNEKNVVIDGNVGFDNLVTTQNIMITDNLLNDSIIDDWITIDSSMGDTLQFENIVSRGSFETQILNNQPINGSAMIFNDSITDEDANLRLPGNVTVHSINTKNFHQFLNNLCLTNVPCLIPDLTISGAMNVDRNADLNGQLNQMIFPEEYVDLTLDETLNITAKKRFKNLNASYVDTRDTLLNNVDLRKIFNLQSEQSITGNLTFEKLEVVENIEIDPGKIKGQAEKFLPNIGLKDSARMTQIDANAEFLQLEVTGEVVIKNTVNAIDFGEYLENVVLKDETPITISGQKHLSQGITVHNMNIRSQMINNISLNSFITKNTPQNLNLSSIPANITFGSLTVNGLYDGQNITQLLGSFVNFSGDQPITSELIFEEEIAVDFLNVTKEHRHVINEGKLENVTAERVEVEGDVEGKVKGIDMDGYLTYTDKQSIRQPFYIKELKCEDISSQSINDMNVTNVFSYGKFRENITDILMYRNANVEVISIEDFLVLGEVNGVDIQRLLNDHPWIKLYRNSSRLVIDGDVHFENVHVRNLANVSFEDYINTIIFKNETNVIFSNSLTFENGIDVENLIETSTLNHVLLKDILRTGGKQVIKGPIRVLGDVSIEDDVTVKEMINNVEVTYMLNNFDIGEEALRVKGEITFQRLPYIRNLTIHGRINDRHFEQLQKEFVFVDDDVELDNNVEFRHEVKIDRNLATFEGINGMNFSNLGSRIVLVTQDTHINGNVEFTHSSECLKSIEVEDAVSTGLLYGQNFTNYINQGIFIDRGLLPGRYSFEKMIVKGNLDSKLVNDLNMSSVIPLTTSQDLGEIDIAEMTVTRNMSVGNEVNGVNLTVERGRTVLGNVDQYIPSEIIFKNNVVVHDLLTTNSINNIPMDKIVTTDTDQNLTASYTFASKTFVNGNFSVSGLISGVNFTTWNTDSLKLQSEHPQAMLNSLKLNSLNLTGPMYEEITVNGLQVNHLIQQIQTKESDFSDTQRKIMDDFDNICQDLTFIYNRTSEQDLKFNYLVELQKLSFKNHINFSYYFEHQNRHYLLINEEGSCFSDLMKFDAGKFVNVSQVSTGIISQIAKVESRTDEIFLVAIREMSNGKCKDEGTAIWKFLGVDIEIIATITPQDLLQNSEEPFVFYGLEKDVVTEFRLNPLQEVRVQEYMKWNVDEDALFVPPGLKTGLAMRTGLELITLNKYEVPADRDNKNLHTDSLIIGNVTRTPNYFIPGKNGGDLAVVNVGVQGGNTNLLAVVSQKESWGDENKFIEIYSNPLNGEIFKRIMVYRPSSLTPITFGNGETILAFMEDQKVLHIYEYKGIEGFRYRFSIKIPATSMFTMDLPIGGPTDKRKVIGLIHNNELTLLQAIMFGNKVPEGLRCSP